MCVGLYVHTGAQVGGGDITNIHTHGGTQGNTDGWTDQQKARLDGQEEFSNGVVFRWMRGRMLWLGASAAE